MRFSSFGHDKSLEIRPYAALPENERPILLYAGDGVSDLSAASETNLLFAKHGKGSAPFGYPSIALQANNLPDLVTFCDRRGIPYTTFKDWSSIFATTKDILAGKVSPSEVASQSKTA